MVTRLSKTRIHTDTSVALQGPVNYAVASGTDTYTADPTPAFTAYVTGAHYFISFTNANTSTTPTLNLNSLGAKTIVKEGTAALAAGDIPASHKAILTYDGTYLVLMNPKARPARIKIGSFTRDMTAATGSVAYTGVGFTPKAVVFLSALSSQSIPLSVGVDDSTGRGTIFTRGSASFITTPSYSIQLETLAGTDFQSGSISAFGADGFTIGWTKTGSPTGTAQIIYMAME